MSLYEIKTSSERKRFSVIRRTVFSVLMVLFLVSFLIS